MSATETVLERPATRPRRSSGVRVTVWVVVLAFAGGLLGLAVGTQVSSAVLAEGTLVVTPLPGNAYSAPGGDHYTDLETESHLVSSDAVLRRVAADGGSAPGVETMRSRLSISVLPDAEVVVIRYRGHTPEQAREMVQRIGRATLDERAERARVAGAARAEVVQGMLDAARTQQESHGDPSPALAKVWSQRLAALNAEMTEALDQSAGPGQLITVVVRGDGGAGKVKLILLVGCVAVAALLGLWVGSGPGRRLD